jgi:HD-GYP domain-containing protein (c-di-GMP phosphodiesterase class II)
MNPMIVEDLVRQIEQRDLSTAAHTWRVVLYARALAEELGVDRDLLRLITHGAALHDVGKLDIPADILLKPGKLTQAEFEVIKLHPVAGYARMIDLGVTDEPILDLVRAHHERWDGLGYPFGLRGEGIPLGARLFAVIDTFDALTSYRPYRADVGPEAAARALTTLTEGSGTRYWPEAVGLFTALYRTGRLGFILQHFTDTCPLPAYAPPARDDGFDALRHGSSVVL